MSAPLFSGDIHDDDADIVNQMLEENPNPPLPPVERITVPTIRKLVPATKLLSGFQQIEPSWSIIPLVPEDPLRKHFRIRVEGTNTTDGIAISSDPAQLINIDGSVRAGRIYVDERETFDDHTGAVYAIGIGAGANGILGASIRVSWWSVTGE